MTGEDQAPFMRGALPFLEALWALRVRTHRHSRRRPLQGSPGFRRFAPWAPLLGLPLGSPKTGLVLRCYTAALAASLGPRLRTSLRTAQWVVYLGGASFQGMMRKGLEGTHIPEGRRFALA